MTPRTAVGAIPLWLPRTPVGAGLKPARNRSQPAGHHEGKCGHAKIKGCFQTSPHDIQ